VTKHQETGRVRLREKLCCAITEDVRDCYGCRENGCCGGVGSREIGGEIYGRGDGGGGSREEGGGAGISFWKGKGGRGGGEISGQE